MSAAFITYSRLEEYATLAVRRNCPEPEQPAVQVARHPQGTGTRGTLTRNDSDIDFRLDGRVDNVRLIEWASGSV